MYLCISSVYDHSLVHERSVYFVYMNNARIRCGKYYRCELREAYSMYRVYAKESSRMYE